jgi:zinc/manganese transport system substrate-binding protein
MSRFYQCAAVVAGGLLLACCGSGGSTSAGATSAGATSATTGSSAAVTSAAGSSSAGATAPVTVVASTDVWGSIVSTIGGDRVKVTSLISDPAVDPHSYEANGQNLLAVSRAALIVQNGGGYDDFLTKMVDSAGSKATVLDAVDISGYAATDGEVNEHVWYDFPTVAKVAVQIRTALTAASPADAAVFSANTAAFNKQLTALEAKEAAIKSSSAGVGVAITEPVPLYLLSAAGLVNRTPPEFSEAIESENDAPASVIVKNLALFSGHQVKALVYNEQTTGPQTEQVLDAAKKNGIAVVPVTETLPAGMDYLAWMNANVDTVAAAVR